MQVIGIDDRNKKEIVLSFTSTDNYFDENDPLQLFIHYKGWNSYITSINDPKIKKLAKLCIMNSKAVTGEMSGKLRHQYLLKLVLLVYLDKNKYRYLAELEDLTKHHV